MVLVVPNRAFERVDFSEKWITMKFWV